MASIIQQYWFLAVLVAALSVGAGRAGAALFTAKSSYTGDWTEASTWTNDNGAWPGEGDDVRITNAASVVILSSTSSNLNSFTNSGIFIFTNWNSALRATNVTILSGGTMKLPSAFTNNQVSNNVYVICANMFIAAGGSINADYAGYAGGNSSGMLDGQGPGGGYGNANYGSGAGHGGRGGRSGSGQSNLRGGEPYGSPTNPALPGSGGGGGNTGGGGGGTVHIQASGPVTVNGTISANGANGASLGGGGAGGSIWIDCDIFAGTNGIVRAWGGDQGNWPGGGGGGGRIAVNYNPANQAAMPKPSVRFIAMPGYGFLEYIYSKITVPDACDLGTLAFPDNALLEPTNVNHVGQWIVPGMTSLACDTLNISDGWIRFPYDGFTLTVTNNMTISGGSFLTRWGGVLDLGATITTNLFALGGIMTNNMAVRNQSLRYGFLCFTNGPVVNVGGNLTLTNKGAIFLGHAINSLPGADYGGLLSVTGTISIFTNSWIYPYAQTTNGMAPLLRMSNLVIAAGGGIKADGAGFLGGFNPFSTTGQGPGGAKATSNYGGGGGHGGRGGRSGISQSNLQGGEPYGSATNPLLPGSGGGGYNPPDWGGSGGGLIRIQASGHVLLNGTLTANSGDAGTVAGGGSGGGIAIQCNTFAGTNGLISANGGAQGNWPGGGGGGGQIAVNYNTGSQSAVSRPTVRCTASPGYGWSEYSKQFYGTPEGADLGTIYFSDTSLLNEGALNHRGQLVIPAGVSNISLATLVVTTGAWFRFPAESFILNVTNDIVIVGSGSTTSTLEFANSLATNNGMAGNANRYNYRGLTSGPTLQCGGNLTLTNGAILGIESGATNAGTPDYGALVSIVSNMDIGPGCWVCPRSHPTNGGSALFQVRSLNIALNGGFSADGLGYAGSDGTAAGWGYGKGGQGVTYGGGGGYGGAGSAAQAPGAGGTTNGSEYTPTDPGSGGGGNNGNSTDGSGIGGYGGGLVRILASDQITLQGSITANGNRYPWYVSSSCNGGGGAGGGIYLTCNIFTGNVWSVLSAVGASPGKPANAGAGGGGRIAVMRSYGASNIVICTVTGGVGFATGNVGTVFWGVVPTSPQGTFFQFF